MPYSKLTVIAFLISAFAVFSHIDTLPLIAPDEGRNAEVAREMSLSWAWLVPTYGGINYLDKPAFYFKTVALALSALGTSEAAARLPSALFGFALLGAVFLFCRHVYGRTTALLALLVVATTPLYMAFSKLVIFDMALAFFVCTSVFACYLAEECEEGPRRRWYLLAAFLAGGATLVKGPVGFMLPTLVITLCNGTKGRPDAWRRFFALPNWAVFLGVVLPWFVGLSLACPDFPYYGIMKESLSRFTTQEFHRSQRFYYYGVIILSCFFPWSLLLPESIVLAWRSRQRWHRADRLFIVWACAVVVFFSLSQSKLPGYILTAVIALGVLTARVLAKAIEQPGHIASGILRRGALVLAVVGGAATAAFAAAINNPEAMEHKLHSNHFLFAMLRPSLLPLAAACAFAALLSALAYWRSSWKTALAAMVSVPLLVLTVGYKPLLTYAETRSSRLLARHLPQDLSPETEIACLECLPNGLPFYLGRLVTVISQNGAELTSNYILFGLNSGKPWPERIVPLAQREAWLDSRKHPVYLLAPGKNLEMLQQIAQRRKVEVQAPIPGYHAILLAKPESEAP